MSNFKVGEIAIVANVVNPAMWGDYLGADVEIISELHMNFLASLAEPAMVYRVLTSDGKKALCRPQDLRKKQPPQELSSWQAVQSLTNWNPAGVPA